MIENLKRIREPIAWAVIAITAANIGLGLVRLVLLLQEQVPVFAAFAAVGTSLLNLTLVVALVALVCTCFFIVPATPHALLVTRVATWVLTVGVVLTFVTSMLGLAASANPLGIVLELIGLLLDLLLKGVAAAALWLLVRGVHAGRIDTAAPRAVIDPPAAGSALPTSTAGDQAAGAVWRTAEQAAAGQPGSASISGPTEAAPADPAP